jgi:hypothetical protein
MHFGNKNPQNKKHEPPTRYCQKRGLKATIFKPKLKLNLISDLDDNMIL